MRFETFVDFFVIARHLQLTFDVRADDEHAFANTKHRIINIYDAFEMSPTFCLLFAGL